jgi:hypothetical protein
MFHLLTGELQGVHQIASRKQVRSGRLVRSQLGRLGFRDKSKGLAGNLRPTGFTFLRAAGRVSLESGLW